MTSSIRGPWRWWNGSPPVRMVVPGRPSLISTKSGETGREWVVCMGSPLTPRSKADRSSRQANRAP